MFNKKSVLIFGLLIFIIYINPEKISAEPSDHIGMTVAWEYGEDNKILRYEKAELLRFTNNTFIPNANESIAEIEYWRYDLLGELELNNIINYTDMWKSIEELTVILEQGGTIENLTILNREIESVHLHRENVQENADYYYDYETGVLVSYSKGTGEFRNLISWDDLDLVSYIAEENKGIPSFPTFLFIFTVIAIFALIFKNNYQKMKNKMIT